MYPSKTVAFPQLLMNFVELFDKKYTQYLDQIKLSLFDSLFCRVSAKIWYLLKIVLFFCKI